MRSDATGRSFLGRLNDLLFFSLEDFEGEARQIIREARSDIVLRRRNGRTVVPAPSTVKTIAERYGVEPARLRKLLLDGGVIDHENGRRMPAHIFIEEVVGERFSKELRQTLDKGEARRALGASSLVFDALRTDGHLELQTCALGGGRERWMGERYQTKDVDHLLKTVRNSVTMDFPTGGMETIASVVQNSGSTYKEVVQLLLGGKLTKVAIAATAGSGFRGVRLDVEEVRSHSLDASRGYVSTKVAAAMLQAPAQAVVKLVGQNLLTPCRRKGPGKIRTGTFFWLGEIEAFDNEFVSLRRLARLGRKRISATREELSAEEIQPAFVAGDMPFYRWSEVPMD